MKKSLIFLITLCMCLFTGTAAYAGALEETTADSSTPRLMISEYKLSADYVTPSEEQTLTVTFKNCSSKKALSNIMLSISDDSGEIKTVGVQNKYVERIYAGGSYTWEIQIVASQTASIGEHILNVSAEYEDKYYNSFSSSGYVSVNVNQQAALEFNGLILPANMYQNASDSITVDFMNSGKCTVKSCKIELAIDGVETGGTVYVGDIEQGESTSVEINLLAIAETTGETKGTATVLWQDEMGNESSETVEIFTNIKEPVAVQTEQDADDGPEYKFWYLFLASGVLIGAAAGAAVPIAVQAKKTRRQDEARL
ncbi:MAG: hypothetical protein LUH82_07340 [Clostridiales bacterium]|nr:hypothetical protein [Clostridiales bacterium]